MSSDHSTYHAHNERYPSKDPGPEDLAGSNKHPKELDMSAITDAITKKPSGSAGLAQKTNPYVNDASNDSDVECDMGGLTASRWVKTPSRLVDKIRAPLKKRKPVGNLTLGSSPTHSYHAPPLFRTSSSSIQANTPFDPTFPPLLRMTSSKGRQLMKEPLLETPASMTTSLWSQISGFSFASLQPSSGTIHSKKVKRPPETVGFINWKRSEDQIGREESTDNRASTIGKAPKLPKVNRNGSQQNVPIPCLSNSAKYQPYVQANPIRKVPRIHIQRPKMHSVKSQLADRNEHTFKSESDSTTSGTETRLNRVDLPLNRWGPEQYDLFNNVPLSDRPCKCSNSRCLKLYCECFQQGLFCDEKLCRCKACLNNKENNDPRGDRMIAIKKILARRPDAFGTRPRKKVAQTCGCKKSG